MEEVHETVDLGAYENRVPEDAEKALKKYLSPYVTRCKSKKKF